MQFNGKQLAALVKMGIAMIHADGKVEENELKFLAFEIATFGVDPNELQTLIAASEKMEVSDAFGTIAALDAQQKVEATAFLGAMIAADGDADESEIKLWALISHLCDLPSMTIGEAIKIMKG